MYKCRNCSNYVCISTEDSPIHHEVTDCSLCRQINWTYWKLESLCGWCMVLIRWLCMSVVSLNMSKFLKHSGCQDSNPFVHCLFFFCQEIYIYMPWIYPKTGVVYKQTAEVNIFQRGSRQAVGCMQLGISSFAGALPKRDWNFQNDTSFSCHNFKCLFSSFWKAKVYMIAAGVIAGVYLLGIVILFLGVKERDGKLYLNMPWFNNSFFTFLYWKDFYFMYSASLRSLCLKFRQSNSFL